MSGNQEEENTPSEQQEQESAPNLEASNSENPPTGEDETKVEAELETSEVLTEEEYKAHLIIPKIWSKSRLRLKSSQVD